jgi:Fe-S cluster biogenesis protein NfuA
LVGHLLVLHGIHPDPVPVRVARALGRLRPHVGHVELLGIEGMVARVRLPAAHGGCGSSADAVEAAVTESVLAIAPELTAVEAVREQAPSLIPVDALLVRTGRRP